MTVRYESEQRLRCFPTHSRRCSHALIGDRLVFPQFNTLNIALQRIRTNITQCHHYSLLKTGKRLMVTLFCRRLTILTYLCVNGLLNDRGKQRKIVRTYCHNSQLQPNSSQQFGEIRSAETCDWVPTFGRWEAIRVTTGVAAGRDIVQRRRAC